MGFCRRLCNLGSVLAVLLVGWYTALPFVAADPPGQYYLVGIGPGDPDLMTLRAVKVIEKCDVIFCSKSIQTKLADYLKGKTVYTDYWRLFPYYGRKPDEFTGEAKRECEEYNRKQNECIQLIRQAIANGKNVAMLDNGDPLVYGPCAWTLEALEDLKPTVVPGVSSFNAANAALKRGVTTSDRTRSVILAAADFPGTEDTIEKLSVHQTTMALFTMRAEFKDFVTKLSLKYPPSTPIAIVQYAGYAEREKVTQTTLGNALKDIDPKSLPFEYMIYVGDFLKHRYNKNTPAQK
jgi:precorrin-4/cobalt-precorrin-4 C11-methyltransferase